MRTRLLVLSLLVPLVAVAGPKDKPKPKPKAPPVEPADPKPAPPATPSDKDSKDKAGGSGGGGDAKDKDGAKDPKDPKDGNGKDAKDGEPDRAGDVDVDTLRQEYLSLRDELFKSRARANAVASQLYSTRIQIKLTYTTGRYYNPAKATIRLDGASVFENTTGGIGADDGVRYDGYVAPGRHLVTFRVEAAGKDDDSFTSVTETQIVVKAVAGKDLILAAKAKDSGDIAYEWKKKEKGSYGLGIDVSVKTAARAPEGNGGGGGGGDAKPAAKKGKK